MGRQVSDVGRPPACSVHLLGPVEPVVLGGELCRGEVCEYVDTQVEGGLVLLVQFVVLVNKTRVVGEDRVALGFLRSRGVGLAERSEITDLAGIGSAL